MGRLVLLTYATAAFAAGQRSLCASALANGFDEVLALGPEALEGTNLARDHAHILSQPRGAGYWLWKPWLIREQVRRMGPDDVLVYSDASADGFYRFDRRPDALLARLAATPEGYVIGPLLRQHGPLRKWAKRDALILLGGDRPDILDRPCVQGSPNLWRPSDAAFALLDAWIAAASDPRILTDQPNQLGQPNHPQFVDHRHDQAILSILAHRDGLPVLDLEETGIFRAMALRPQALMTNRFLKSPHTINALLAGDNARLRFFGAMIGERLARALRRA